MDRALMNSDWLTMFPFAKLYNLEASSSDHSPILLVLDVVKRICGRRSFRFENAWLTEPMCRQSVLESWDSSVESDIQHKVKVCGENLEQWGKEITGRFNDRIKNCKMEIRRLRKFRDASSVQKYMEAKENMAKILGQKEIFWRQRSKQLWLHSGTRTVGIFTLLHLLEGDLISYLNCKMGRGSGWIGMMDWLSI